MNVESTTELIDIKIPIEETRLMAPDGENFRSNLYPTNRKIVLKTISRGEIYKFRQRMLKYETIKVLGQSKPTTKKQKCFWSSSVSTLYINFITRKYDLSLITKKKRQELKELYFNKFVINIQKT